MKPQQALILPWIEGREGRRTYLQPVSAGLLLRCRLYISFSVLHSWSQIMEWRLKRARPGWSLAHAQSPVLEGSRDLRPRLTPLCIVAPHHGSHPESRALGGIFTTLYQKSLLSPFPLIYILWYQNKSSRCLTILIKYLYHFASWVLSHSWVYNLVSSAKILHPTNPQAHDTRYKIQDTSQLYYL
jgi:hypothetical protein